MKKLLLVGCLTLATLSFAWAQSAKPTRPQTFPSYVQLDGGLMLSQKAQVWSEFLKTTPNDELKMLKTEVDQLGLVHEKYQQFYKGVEVEGATYTLHARDGKIMHMTGNYRTVENLNVAPTLSESAAFAAAVAHVGAKKYMWEEAGTSMHAHDEAYEKPSGSLVVVADPEAKAAPRLAYKFDIYASEPLYRAYVYVDANSGAYLQENLRIHHANVSATGTSLYDGTVAITADNASGPYRLRQTADGGGIETYDLNNGTNYNNASDITSSSTAFTATGVRTGVQAHFGAEQTHKYFSQNHNRNSYNGSGAVIRSYVSYSSNYVNAFWNGSVMTYGDGDGVNYGPLVSLDIVGHEITHGVTEYTANLVYSYQSGALNESFSDIFGESIENFGTGTNDWLMGDNIGAGGSGGALRSMSNPNQYGDPDTYLGTNWYSGSGDNGGVHYNSGVQNKWFYILTVGESGTNDNGDSYSVTGIGMSAAAAIAYRNLSVYLTSSSNYAAARTGAIQAAVDLYGAGSAEEIATTDAWYAVGVGSPYGPPPPTTCYDGAVDLSITLDNYPAETSWTLKTAAGATVASGGSYSGAGSSVSQSFSLVDGDYTFTILDSYGDGICCAYGSGSYSLASGTTTIVSGGNFGSTEVTSFCVENSGPGPILGCMDPSAHNYDPAATQDDGSCEDCTDGVQNGDETGVDCGGALCAPCGGGGGSTVLLASYFESGWDGWADGGSDSYRYAGSRSYEGTYSIRLRDNTNSSVMTSGSYNLTGYSQVDIEFFFYAYSMETGEDFWVQYNDGSGWQTVAAYAQGTSFNNNTFYTATVTLTSASVNLSSAGSFRFRCDASANADQVYIDQVTITASSPFALIPGGIAQSIAPVSKIGGEVAEVGAVDFEGDFGVYPNPAQELLHITIDEAVQSIQMYHINGQLIRTIQVGEELSPIDVSDLATGMYIIAVQTESEVHHARFLKQ